jgi:hypothetical protein
MRTFWNITSNNENKQLSIAEAFKHTERRAIALALLLPLLASLLLFLVDFQQKKQSANYFTEVLRYEIIRGSLRDALYQTERMVKQDGPFYRIRYIDFHSDSAIDQKGRQSTPIFSNSIKSRVHFSSSEESDPAGELIYAYGLDKIILVSIFLCALSMTLVLIYILKQRSELGRRIDHELNLQRNEAIARTINSLAHDLRAPLNIIEIFLNQNSGRDSANYKTAKQGLSRIYAMIEALKHNEADFIRPELKKFEMEYVNGAMQKLAESLGKSFTVGGEIAIDLYADHVKVERVLQNLIVNALEAAQSAVHVYFEKGPDWVRISITDDGLGVPKEIESTLFQRGATFGKRGGTGLGLAYCKTVIDGHDGIIGYDRKNDRTRFYIEIPTLQSNRNNETPSTGKTSTTRKPSIVALLLSDNDCKAQVRLLIQKELENLRIAPDNQNPEDAQLVIVDDLDVMLSLTKPHQIVIFKKPNDSLETVMKKIKMELH